jgi:TolB-like protein
LTREFGSRTPIDTIHSRLGASYALSGVVRRKPDGFDVFAQLVRARDRGHIWAIRLLDSASDDAVVGRRIADSVAAILLDTRTERVPLGIEVTLVNHDPPR